jgi:hypothetical protein
MGIKTEYPPDSTATHNLETHAIDKTEPATGSPEESVYTGTMFGFADPNNVEQGIYIVLELS